MSATPFVDLAEQNPPRDPVKNMEWRVRWRSVADTNPYVQEAFREAAYSDVLWWFHAFCFCYEPRSRLRERPFVPWVHQDDAILKMDGAIDKAEISEDPFDVVVDKSRGQGASWIFMMVLLRRWLRDRLFAAGIVSRNEKSVDSANDPDTLLWKFNWALGMLPFWMLPKQGWTRNLTDHSFVNHENSSTIVGYSATGDVASGGRKLIFGIDEEAKFKQAELLAALDSLQHVTNCLVHISTHKGDTGPYFEAVNDESSTAIKIILDWKDNPTQNKLLYRYKLGNAVAMRQEESLDVFAYQAQAMKDGTWRKLERRGFKLDGTIRSPWYDNRCLRPLATPRSIAQELDRNPRGSVGKVFPSDVLDDMRARHAKRPVWQGRVVVDPHTCDITGFLEQPDGPLKLWFKPSLDDAPPSGRFVLGADVAVGTGGEYASNSTIEGVSCETGEQVLEFASKDITAYNLARLAVALGRWLNDAVITWETTGPTGMTFKLTVTRKLRYANLWHARDPKSNRRAKEPGWHNASNEAKSELFEQLAIGMADGDFIPRSEDLLRECNEYEWEGGEVIHKPSKIKKEAGAQHGDRAVGAGVMWLAARDWIESRIDNEGEIRQIAPIGSIAWSDQQEAMERRAFDDESDPFCINDLMRSCV